jgi:ribosomal-protein-alanine N-acetyltransferase
MNKSTNFPQLETDRLVLRKLTYGDTDVVFTHFANEEVSRYVDAHPAENSNDAREIIGWGNYLADNKMGALWGIFRREDGPFLGQVNCVFRPDNNFSMNVHRAEIGYDLTPSYWGKGYMAEAIASVISFIFSNTSIDRIEATIHPENTRSHNVVERAGFVKEGVLRQYVLWEGEHWDMVHYSLLKQEWGAGTSP